MESIIEEGLKEGYLEDKVIIVKPVQRGEVKAKDDKGRSVFFLEGAMYGFEPKQKNSFEYVSVFKDEKEMQYFQRALSVSDLRANLDNPFWNANMNVILKNEPGTESVGWKFNLRDPHENLMVRILKQYSDPQKRIVALDEEQMGEPDVRYVLTDSTSKLTKAAKEMDLKVKVMKHWTTIAGSNEKMKTFLEIYNMTHKLDSIKKIPDPCTNEWLINEFGVITSNDYEKYLKVADDENYNAKVMLLEAIKAGVVERHGVDSYKIVGEPITRTMHELCNLLSTNETDEYHRVKQQVELNKKKKTKKEDKD